MLYNSSLLLIAALKASLSAALSPCKAYIVAKSLLLSILLFILFELFTGQPPFYTNSIFQLVTMILKDAIKWPPVQNDKNNKDNENKEGNGRKRDNNFSSGTGVRLAHDRFKSGNNENNNRKRASPSQRMFENNNNYNNKKIKR